MPRPSHPLLSTLEWQEAVAHQNAGRFAVAAKQFTAMVRNAPDCPEVYCNLAIIANHTGNYGMAVALARQAAHIAPGVVTPLCVAGNALLNAGRAKEAETWFKQALAASPQDAECHFHLGNAFTVQNRQVDAEKAFRSAVKLNPQYAEAWLNLGNVLREKQLPLEALEAYRRSAALRPGHALAHNSIGNALRDLDQLQEATLAYRRATELNPDYALAHFNLGNTLRDQGRAEEAVVSYRNAVRVNRFYGDAHRHLAITGKFRPEDSDILAMQEVYKNPAAPIVERMYIAFGLGFVHDRIADYDKAFSYFEEGNHLKRLTLAYAAEKESARFANIQKAHDAAFLGPEGARSRITEAPILIVGMMRSGSSLLEQILASHPQIRGAGELTTMSQLIDPPSDGAAPRQFPHNTLKMKARDWEKLGSDYLRAVRLRLGDDVPRFTDKLPQNFLYLGAFARALPNTRVLNMTRNPLDVCLSIYSHLFSGGHSYAYNLEELGKYYIAYHRLMEHWHKINPGMVRDVNYHDLVEKTEETVREILDYLELPFDPACLEFHKTQRGVKTVSTLQVREKIYKSSVARWRNYEKQLAPLRAMFEAAGIDC